MTRNPILVLTIFGIVSFLGALAANSVVKGFVQKQYEKRNPAKMLEVRGSGGYIDLSAPVVGDKITIFNNAERANFRDIEVMFTFYNQDDQVVSKKSHFYPEVLYPRTERDFKAPRSLSDLFRYRAIIQVVNATGF